MIPRICGISGSLREASFSQQALEIALHKAKAMGAEIQALHLKNLALPFCNGGDFYPEFPDVEILRESVLKADCLLISSPEYHGGISGVLKNAIDLLSQKHFQNKKVGIISVLGGIPSTNAVNQLVQICHNLHAWVLPRPLILSDAGQAFSEKGSFSDPQIEKRLSVLIDQLTCMT